MTATAIRALFRRRADFVVLDADRLTTNPRLVGVMALVNAPDGDREPRIVLATSRARLAEDPSVAKATVAALLRGYAQTQVDPESSLSDLQAEFEGLNRAALTTRSTRPSSSSCSRPAARSARCRRVTDATTPRSWRPRRRRRTRRSGGQAASTAERDVAQRDSTRRTSPGATTRSAAAIPYGRGT